MIWTGMQVVMSRSVQETKTFNMRTTKSDLASSTCFVLHLPRSWRMRMSLRKNLHNCGLWWGWCGWIEDGRRPLVRTHHGSNVICKTFWNTIYANADTRSSSQRVERPVSPSRRWSRRARRGCSGGLKKCCVTLVVVESCVRLAKTKKSTQI